MNQERGSDPFMDPYQQGVQPPGQQPLGGSAAPPQQTGTQYNSGTAYGGAGMQGVPPAGMPPGYGGYSSYGGGYNSGYGGGYGGMYSGGYSGGYGGGYGVPYGSYGMQRQNATAQLASGARETGAMVLSGMHEAMARFARVSSMIEEVLRNLHMLFDAVFGLGYSVGAFRQEAGQWLAIKTGPVGYLARLLRRAANVWRLLCLFFLSPAAGRFSPVALVLRILGLVPEEDPLDASLAELWRSSEPRSADRENSAFGAFNSHPLADNSNM